jgi:uncharacterized protein (TIGR02271 family)
VNAQSPIVAGVFEQFPQARQAYLDLQAAGFTDEQIGVAQHNREEIDLGQSFRQLGMTPEQASAYDQQYRAGRIIVSVRPDGRGQEAQTILQRNGASNDLTGSSIDEQTANQQVVGPYTSTGLQLSGTTGADATDVDAQGDVAGNRDTVVGTGGYANEASEEQALRLREERLHVDKERVQTGQVQIHKEVVTEQKTITVPVTHEEVVIEHRSVAPNQAGEVAPIGSEETIRIPVSEEQVSVTKRPVVTNEVVVGKREVEQTQRVSDTVRHEEARVDREGTVSIHGLDETVANSEKSQSVDRTDVD